MYNQQLLKGFTKTHLFHGGWFSIYLPGWSIVLPKYVSGYCMIPAIGIVPVKSDETLELQQYCGQKRNSEHKFL